MKTFILTGLSVLALSTSVMAQDAASDELSKKLTLAKQYSQAVPVEKEVANAIEGLVVQVPKEDRVLFKSILDRTIDVSRVRSASEMALAELFTVQELEAMIEFYNSPEGQAVREKMPEYESRLEPVLGQMVRTAVESYAAQKQN